MGSLHDPGMVVIPLNLLKRLIGYTEAASEVALAEYSSQVSAANAHATAEQACRIAMDQGFRLDD